MLCHMYTGLFKPLTQYTFCYIVIDTHTLLYTHTTIKLISSTDPFNTFTAGRDEHHPYVTEVVFYRTPYSIYTQFFFFFNIGA